jgi:peptidoglycan/xylan/chitin deacetylase (PgdA/CDA1 family)
MSGRRTKGLFALTFDDAYAALPALIGGDIATLKLPVTVFVPTGFVDAGRAFWWDRLDDLRVALGDAAMGAFERRLGVPEAFKMGHAAAGGFWPARQWILAEMAGRLAPHVEAALAVFEQEVGVRTRHRAMRWDELTTFAASPLVDVGVHTQSHPVLPLLPLQEQEHEIRGCFAALRHRIPKALPILAVPYGLYDAATASIARRAGMEATLTMDETCLGFPLPDGVVPRITANHGLRGWRLALRTSGRLDTVVRRRHGFTRPYPPLPSATA